MSQEQLANRAGLSHPVITKSENGKNLPRAEALDKLAQALDCTMDYLHGRGQAYESTSAAAAHGVERFPIYAGSERRAA